MRHRIGIVLSGLLMAGFIIPYNYQWLMPPPKDVYRRMDTADVTKALLLAPSDVQSLITTSTIKVNAPVVRVQSGEAGGGSTTLLTTPSIPDGIPGQLLLVQGMSDTKVVMLRSESKMAGSNLVLKDSTRTLEANNTLLLMFLSPYPRHQTPPSSAAWHEISYSKDNTDVFVNGSLTAGTVIYWPGGSLSAPGLAIRNASDDGFFAPGQDTIYVVINAGKVLQVGPSVTTALTGLRVGTSSMSETIASIVRRQFTLDFPLTSAQTSSDMKIAVTGAQLVSTTSLGVPVDAVLGNSCYTAWASSADTVTVRFNNYDSVAANPPGGVFCVDVLNW